MSKISLKHSGGNVVSLNSPTNAPGAADVAFKLPNADGSAGQFIKTDGSGNLSFAAAGGGGKILQVLQDTKTDVQSFTVSSSGQYGTILGTVSGLSQAITLSNASHQVLVQGFISLGSSYSGDTSISVSLERDNAQIAGAIGDADGSRRRNMFTAHIAASARGPVPFPFSFLDTPGSVGAHTYSIEISHQYAGTGTYYVNRGNASDNNIYNTMGISVITVMEYDPT
jgi:hypothetical protein